MKIKIRDAVKKDMLQVHNLIVELAVFEKEPEEVDIEFGENAYRNDLPENYAELDTTDITVTITKQQEPLVISLTSE